MRLRRLLLILLVTLLILVVLFFLAQPPSASCSAGRVDASDGVTSARTWRSTFLPPMNGLSYAIEWTAEVT